MSSVLARPSAACSTPVRGADFADDLPVVRRSELLLADAWSRRWFSLAVWTALPFGVLAVGMWQNMAAISILALGMWVYIVAGDFVARGLQRAVQAYAHGQFELAQTLLRRSGTEQHRRPVQRYLVAAAHARGDLHAALEASERLIEDIERTSSATVTEAWEARACRVWLLLEHREVDLAERELSRLPPTQPGGRLEWIEIELSLALEYAADRTPSRALLARAEDALAGVAAAPDVAERLSLLIVLVQRGWARRGNDVRARTWRGLMHSHGDRDRALARLESIGRIGRHELAPYRR